MRIVSVKLPEDLVRELTRIARQRRASRSAVLREALETFAQSSQRSVTAAAGDLVGSLRGPRDLSTNPKHLPGRRSLEAVTARELSNKPWMAFAGVFEGNESDSESVDDAIKQHP
jgi:Arc/MetJ-type ribon-helix-helix transcriptional regulator